MKFFPGICFESAFQFSVYLQGISLKQSSIVPLSVVKTSIIIYCEHITLVLCFFPQSYKSCFLLPYIVIASRDET